MEKYQKTFEEITPLLKRMREECFEFLNRALSEHPNGFGLKEFEDNSGVSVCVTYDGGNHPEYNSNCFSQVNAAYLKGNDIYLDIDETDEYSIDNIDIQDVENIAELVKSIIDFQNKG